MHSERIIAEFDFLGGYIMSNVFLGDKMYALAQELWPICRSISGDGIRHSIKLIKKYLPDLKVVEVDSGTQVFDWVIPQEWNINDAFVANSSGERIIDFKKNNLHVVGYSIPVDMTVDLDELQNHLYSLPKQPDAIPYVTSYYTPWWGFCLADNERKKLLPDSYRVMIDSKLSNGSLSYGELIIPGETEDEILISTYICHPSMANNELSGPCVTTYLAQWISSEPRRYTYRILFLPETIGAITYISKHIEKLKKNVKAGFIVTCIGDEKEYSYLASKYGDTLADQVAKNVLSEIDPLFKRYTYLDRGSDERQFCSPGVDLPVVSIMRSKYGTYPEYHTSLDDLNFISSKGLGDSLHVLKQVMFTLESNCYPKVTVCCEPQLGKRGLYPTLSTKESTLSVRTMMNLLAYADGKNSLLDLSDMLGVPFVELHDICKKLEDNGPIMAFYNKSE